MQSRLLEFESTMFEVVEGEDEETNPGMYGKALAAWLASGLDLSRDALIAEDFGWCIRVRSTPHRLYVACSSAPFSREKWLVFVFAEGGLLARVLGRDSRAADVASLFARIRAIVEAEPRISGIVESEE